MELISGPEILYVDVALDEETIENHSFSYEGGALILNVRPGPDSFVPGDLHEALSWISCRFGGGGVILHIEGHDIRGNFTK